MKTKARKPFPRYLSRTLDVSICAASAHTPGVTLLKLENERHVILW